MPHAKLTEAWLKANHPKIAADRKDWWDEGLPGFGFRPGAKGGTFSVLIRVEGRQRRIGIGKWPGVSVEIARRKAKELLGQAAMGEPLAEMRDTARGGVTVGDAIQVWVRRWKLRPSASGTGVVLYRIDPRLIFPKENLALGGGKLRATGDMAVFPLAESTARVWASNLRLHILPEIGAKPLRGLHPADLRKLHVTATDKGGPVVANRIITVLSSFFSWAVANELMDANPLIQWKTEGKAKIIQRNPEQDGRKSYLSNEEIQRVSAYLDASHHVGSADVVRLCLLLGARSGEILSMEWVHLTLDSERPSWLKPSSKTKQQRSHQSHLAEDAANLLRRRFITQNAEMTERIGFVSDLEARAADMADLVRGLRRVDRRLALLIEGYMDTGEALSALRRAIEERYRWVFPSAQTGGKDRQYRYAKAAANARTKNALKREAARDGLASFSGHMTSIRTFWKRLCTTCKLQDVHIHDLRHTTASLLISNGESLAAVGRLLGHSSEKTTNRYAHLLGEDRRRMSERLAALIKPKPPLSRVVDADSVLRRLLATGIPLEEAKRILGF